MGGVFLDGLQTSEHQTDVDLQVHVCATTEMVYAQALSN